MNDMAVFKDLFSEHIPAMGDMFADQRFMKTRYWGCVKWQNGKNYCVDKMWEIYKKHYLTPTRKAKLIRKYVTG